MALNEDLDADLPLVNCDYNQIKQVLINLLINALDAVDEHGAITVRTVHKKNKTYLSVEDNGTGILPEIIGNIFNPFFTTKTRGTGLGLAISKKIARQHGGDLNVESTPGKGSTFTLVLND